MRKAAYNMMGTSVILFIIFLAFWLIGLLTGTTLGGFIHLLLPATVIPMIGFFVGLILFIVSAAKK